MEHLAGHVDYASGLFLWLSKTTSSFVNKTISVTSTFADDDVGEQEEGFGAEVFLVVKDDLDW